MRFLCLEKSIRAGILKLQTPSVCVFFACSSGNGKSVLCGAARRQVLLLLLLACHPDHGR